MDESLALLESRGKVLSGWTTGTGTAVATDDGYAFWDGDDMTMEMVTDLDDGNVDEEAECISGWYYPIVFANWHV